MNREGIIKHRAVFEAWLEGKDIEIMRDSQGWRSITHPHFTTASEYRVKPEPRVFYMNLWNEGEVGTVAYDHTSLYAAREACLNNKAVTTIKVVEVLE